MAKMDISDLRFSSSGIDDFMQGKQPPNIHTASGKIRVANLNQLAGFDYIGSDTLVRTSKQDFWKLGQDKDGYFIERLVSDDDGPIKDED